MAMEHTVLAYFKLENLRLLKAYYTKAHVFRYTVTIQIGLMLNGATFEWLVYLKSRDFKWSNTSWQLTIPIPDQSSANRATIPKPNHLNTSLQKGSGTEGLNH